MNNMKLIEAELAKAAQLIISADNLGIERMSKLDELWEIERKAAEMRHELNEVYKRIDKLLPDEESK